MTEYTWREKMGVGDETDIPEAVFRRPWCENCGKARMSLLCADVKKMGDGSHRIRFRFYCYLCKNRTPAFRLKITDYKSEELKDD